MTLILNKMDLFSISRLVFPPDEPEPDFRDKLFRKKYPI